MEHSHFNREAAINNYVLLIKNQGCLSASDHEELAGHLHDSTEALLKQGLIEEEAFLIARKRIGNVDLLTEEYSKVNASVKNDRIWTYLLVGFNVFYGIPAVSLTAVVFIYYCIYKLFGQSMNADIVISTVHLIMVMGLWSMLKYKRRWSSLIQEHIEKAPFLSIAVTSIPTITSIFFLSSFQKLMPGMSIMFPVRMFSGKFAEFSFYMVGFSLVGVVLSLIFSIKTGGNVTSKTLFEKPSKSFLLLFGFFVALIAASTRALNFENMLVQSTLFGLVYAAASFLISYYNTEGNGKYLLLSIGIGLVLETVVGINADIARGNTYFTLYFVSALLTGAMVGRIGGLRIKAKNALQ